MSLEEKKALAFEKLTALTNEASVDEILAHLSKLSNEVKQHVYNLSNHYEAISAQYNDTLQKLAE